MHSITKEPQYEIRIKSDKRSLIEFQELLKNNNVEFRLIGLPVFPPPMSIWVENAFLEDAMNPLLTWYSSNRSGNPEISILMPNGDLATIQDDRDIKHLAAIAKTERN